MDKFLLGFILGFPYIAAFAVILIGRKSETIRDYFADFACAAILLAAAILAARYSEPLELSLSGLLASGLHFYCDGFRALYVFIAALMWFVSTLFSHEYLTHYTDRTRYYFFVLFTLGATLGVFLSTDFMSTLVFFEIMSFTSYTWVAHEQTEDAMRAANTYLAVAVIGGMVMLMGMFLVYDALGTLTFSELRSAYFAASGKHTQVFIGSLLMLFGYGAKAGMFPLHIWLPKAHPVAPAPASALLSGILTKAGIFGILAITSNIMFAQTAWGYTLLLLGAITMAGGAILAVFSVNLKRTLACSSMSQIGFILVGIASSTLLGSENALALRGIILHMANHSLIKLVLFCCAGIIYMHLHKLGLNELSGYGRKKPWLAFVFALGALSIGGIPGMSGYISKTLLHEAIVEFAAELAAEGASVLFIKAVEYTFLFTGGLTIAYMLKLFVAVFVDKNLDSARQADYDKKTKYVSTPTAICLSAVALLFVIFGSLPYISADKISSALFGFMHCEGEVTKIAYFGWESLKGACISLTIGLTVYFGFIRRVLWSKEKGYKYISAPKLDLENRLYRPLIGSIIPNALYAISRIFAENRVSGALYKAAKSAMERISALFAQNAVSGRLYEYGLLALRIASKVSNDSLDHVIAKSRKSVFADALPHDKNPFGLPAALSRTLLSLRAKLHGDKDKTVSAVYAARVFETIRRTNRAVGVSFSFSMLLTSLGIATILLIALCMLFF